MCWCNAHWNVAAFCFFSSTHSLNIIIKSFTPSYFWWNRPLAFPSPFLSLPPSLWGPEGGRSGTDADIWSPYELKPQSQHHTSFPSFYTSPTSDTCGFFKDKRHGVISVPVTSAHSYWFLVFFPLLVYVESVVCLCSASVGGLCPFVWKTHQTAARGTHDALDGIGMVIFFALSCCHWLWSLFFIFSPFMENIIRQKKDGRHYARVSAVCWRNASFSGKKNAVLLAKPNMSWSETIQRSSGGVNSSVPHYMFPQTVSHYRWGANQRGLLCIAAML